MSENRIPFRDFVEARTVRLDVTVRELATSLNVKRTSVYNWLNQNRWPKGVAEELSPILVFEIVRMDGLELDVTAVGVKKEKCSVAAWIDASKSRRRKKPKRSDRPADVASNPPAAGGAPGDPRDIASCLSRAEVEYRRNLLFGEQLQTLKKVVEEIYRARNAARSVRAALAEKGHEALGEYGEAIRPAANNLTNILFAGRATLPNHLFEPIHDVHGIISRFFTLCGLYRVSHGKIVATSGIGRSADDLLRDLENKFKDVLLIVHCYIGLRQ